MSGSEGGEREVTFQVHTLPPLPCHLLAELRGPTLRLDLGDSFLRKLVPAPLSGPFLAPLVGSGQGTPVVVVGKG